ncbi:helix-turn-helix transcriptional regulator [Tumebacillus avium]|uniref:helix-turn-helix transcriptional regulator n=1 Tax=Tumebacillus avium TaxID=1903704 RepID=UPI0012FE2F42|nr:helix-turn-helix transcriptional regulator [Tumebacillus avium]
MTIHWLETKRKAYGLSQEKLADLIGVHRSYVSKLEKGRQPSVEVAQRLSDILAFQWTEFFERRVSECTAPPFVPQLVLVSFENSSDEHPHTIMEESLLFCPVLAISRMEKCLESGCVTFWVRRVEQLENSTYYREIASYPDLLFYDSEKLLQDMTCLTFAGLLHKYFAEDTF